MRRLYDLENTTTNESGKENIRRFWDIRSGKRNILYLLHLDFRENVGNNPGGTQLNVNHLKDELKYNNNIFVAAIDGRFLQLTAYIQDKEYKVRTNLIGKFNPQQASLLTTTTQQNNTAIKPAANFDTQTGKPTSAGYKNYKNLSPEAQARIRQENAVKKQQKAAAKVAKQQK